MSLLDVLLGALVIAALLGWAVSNALYARATLPMMNAFRVLLEVDYKFDQRVNAILDRAKANIKRPEIPTGRPEAAKAPPYNPALFATAGTPPLIPSFMDEDQPEAGLEHADA